MATKRLVVRNGGSEFSILVRNPFVETHPWLKLEACLEASMGGSEFSILVRTPFVEY